VTQVNFSSKSSKKKTIVIAGGGTTGWLASAALGKVFKKLYHVVLIESDEIGRVGVGEATIPPLRTFHRLLGIDETEFMRETQATIKLGIEFHNWGKQDEKYFHSFGNSGKDCWACDFQHFWLAGKQKGLHNEPIGVYCREYLAAQENKAFAGDNSGVQYAYHLDAGLYADYLKKRSLADGVEHVEGIIDKVNIKPEDGSIANLELNDGRKISGDLFLDCTGFSARLISGALNVGYESYSHFLPCDSAVAVQTEKVSGTKPYTQAIAHPFGWQWRIPLQNRTGNGLVYASRYVSDEDAKSALLNNLESSTITQTRSFKYHTGRRNKAWHKNCIAIGLAAGFLEPVESTSIHLAMSTVLRLLKFFPTGEITDTNRDEFNDQTQIEMERTRNFIILHYHATEREDSAFWRYCKDMEIPDSLRHRIELFKDTGSVPIEMKELFQIDSWTQVMLGQHIEPNAYHPIVDVMSDKELDNFLLMLKNKVRAQVNAMPEHQKFLDDYCKAATLDMAS
jgi:tryptophan halogenase